MIKVVKKLVLILCFLSFFVVNIEVKAEEALMPDNVSLYQAVNDVPLIEGEKQIATLKKSSYVYLEQTTQADLYLQFGGGMVKVDASSFQLLGDLEDIKPPAYNSFQSEENSFLVYKQSDNGVEPSSKESVVEFKADGQYPILHETDQIFKTLIGNRVVIIEKEVPSDVYSALGTETTQAPLDVQSDADTKLSDSPKTNIAAPSNNTFIQSVTTSFNGTEKFLKVSNSAVPVYLNNNGKNIKAGELTSGQEYVIISHSDGWLKLRFGNGYAYVRSNEVIPGNGLSIKNLNNNRLNIDRFFKTYKKLPIYDNTSGSLVEFGEIETGFEYPIIRQSSANWLEIDFAGRIGYVYVPHLHLVVNKTDRFFTTLQEETPFFINKGGSSIYVGKLALNQQYPILDVIPGFVQIKYGTGFAYVRTGTIIPSSGDAIKNQNNNLSNSGKLFNTYRRLAIYDNTSGSLVQFGEINGGQLYPYIKQTSSDWIMVDLSGRIGYVYMPHLILPLTQSDKYFKTVYGKTPIYINENGKNIKMADMQQGQEFPIISQIPDFVKVQYGESFAYIRIAYLSASTGTSIKNLTAGSPKVDRTLTAKINTPVYDNTSGKLVEFGQLEPGTRYPIIQETSPFWIKVNFGGRIGYIYKPRVEIDFKPSDQFLQPLDRDIPVYANQNGIDVVVAKFLNGQKYKIHSFIPGFIRVQYGNILGSVRTSDAYPADGSGITNLNLGLENSFKNIRTEQVVKVYDKTTDSKMAFATLEPGQSYPIIEQQQSSEWLQISIGGRIGYVYKSSVVVAGAIKIYQNTNYTISFENAFEKQWVTQPQTDKRYNAYISSSYVTLDSSNPSVGYVNAVDGLNVRGGPNTSFWTLGKLKYGTKVTIIGPSDTWYQIDFTQYWRNASPDDVRYYLDPKNVLDSKDNYQFLKLSGTAGLNVAEVNTKVLAGKGILENQAQAFIDSAFKYNINDVYLISHALLETGNGKSRLANGILVSTVDGKAVTPRIVYNLFGIGAYDTCAEECGAERAYKEGWFSIKDAINGGAKFLGEKYINDPFYKQDTLYKMKWNPAAPGTHQYASDIGWAYKQVYKINELYNLLDNYQIVFDVPVYQ